MTETLSHEELAGVLFGQQHVLTQTYFTRRFRQYHTIELKDSPHFHFLQQHPIASETEYAEYLACSWDYYYGATANSPERRQEREEAFAQLFEDVRSKGAVEKPLKLCTRPDGRFVIVDGNHRAAVALKLGLNVPVNFVPLVEQLGEVVSVPDEFYGTKRLNQPYQSICHRGQEFIKGRRPDILERIQMIAAGDLESQSVLDLGCNLGMNCYLAAERGAREVLGVEGSPVIASAAVRLNAYFGLPCFFIAHDLNQKLGGVGKFDTVFCFSLVDHLRNKDGILATLKETVGKVLYFEGHAASALKDYEYVLTSDNFADISLIGYGHDGIHSNRSSRPLFRCEIRQDKRDAGARQEVVSEFISQWKPQWLPDWTGAGQRAQRDPVCEEILSLIPKDDAFILVDEDQIRASLEVGIRSLPFVEHDGEYWGPPADDQSAIQELKRLWHQGARFLVVTAPAFWWLDYYAGWNRHLRGSFPCLLENERLVVFDLRSQPGTI